MDKRQVAAALEEIAMLLELTGGNMFQLRAYTNAARLIESLDQDLGALVASGELGELKGIGPALVEKITTLVTTGSLPYLDDLRAKFRHFIHDIDDLPRMPAREIQTAGGGCNQVWRKEFDFHNWRLRFIGTDRRAQAGRGW